MVEMQPVPESTKVAEMGYDAPNKEIHVKMRDGRSWAFMNATPEDWDKLRNAGSKGAYVNVVLMQARGRRPLR